MRNWALKALGILAAVGVMSGVLMAIGAVSVATGNPLGEFPDNDKIVFGGRIAIICDITPDTVVMMGELAMLMQGSDLSCVVLTVPAGSPSTILIRSHAPKAPPAAPGKPKAPPAAPGEGTEGDTDH